MHTSVFKTSVLLKSLGNRLGTKFRLGVWLAMLCNHSQLQPCQNCSDPALVSMMLLQRLLLAYPNVKLVRGTLIRSKQTSRI